MYSKWLVKGAEREDSRVPEREQLTLSFKSKRYKSSFFAKKKKKDKKESRKSRPNKKPYRARRSRFFGWLRSDVGEKFV